MWFSMGDEMTNSFRALCLSLLFSLSASSLLLYGQIQPLASTPDFVSTSEAASLLISREAVPIKPFSVVGPRGAILGQQDGRFEAWIFPWKIFSGMGISAEMENYPVPIDVNKQAAWIEVKPNYTAITYSHANFTMKQIMLAPKESQTGMGVLVFYKIQAVRPMTLTFSFDPTLQRMWPAESGDHPSAEWIAASGGSGFYILRDTFPDHYAALAIPGAEAGILPPYQERAAVWPLQFVLHFDPKRDRDTLFPLLITFAEHSKDIDKGAAAKMLAALDTAAESMFRANESYYRKFLNERTSIQTPDVRLNAAFSWAELAIDQLRVQTTSDPRLSALTAGFVGSGDAARPGFGWFFGRDALWSLYAVNSYGDFETAREEIEFLLQHQRPDGKIMHEWSQTADLVDWKSLPYEYASSDATPLLQMAVDDYVKISGDAAFARANWDALARAWQFETSHDSADGIYNNDEGSGWVESWVPAMPHQEIYLAALDEQASLAFADLARAVGHNDSADQATVRARKIGEAIEKEYYLSSSGFYAFSHNLDGSNDSTPTIFPSVAWWDGTFGLAHPESMLARWASSEFSTDWGTRVLSDQVSFYDPISYHQGSVWPLFTGWVSLAEYRTAHPVSGYEHLMQNANLTWSQDLGSVTELLSGKFYQVLGRSTAHQLWSSAMVISPVLRGMFGLEWNAQSHTLRVTPHLPADWTTATVRRVPLENISVDLSFTRRGPVLIVEIVGGATGVHLQSRAEGARIAADSLHLPLPEVEIAAKQELPEFGAETRQMKVLDEQYTERSLSLVVAAPASSRQTLLLRENASNLKIQTRDAEMGAANNGLRTVTISFPRGEGYATKTIEFSW
jgi:glycogen debranching enzyme